jgi:dTDP-4-dehydrorhamnose reductase
MAMNGRASEAGRTSPKQLLDRISEWAGTYDLAGDGFATRFQWAEEILAVDSRRNEQMVQELLPAKTSDFPTAAKRPLFSALDCGKFERTFGFRLAIDICTSEACLDTDRQPTL